MTVEALSVGFIAPGSRSPLLGRFQVKNHTNTTPTGWGLGEELVTAPSKIFKITENRNTPQVNLGRVLRFEMQQSIKRRDEVSFLLQFAWVLVDFQ